MAITRSLRAALCSWKSLAGTALTFWILGVSISAFAQTANSNAVLPDAPSVATSSTVDHSLTFAQRFRTYRRGVISPQTIIGPAFGAGISQWEGEPPGWRQGAEGYGRRIGSDIGRDVISKTITFGFAAVDGEDPRHFRSQDPSVWGRIKYGVVSSFVSPTASGRRIPAFSRFAGIYGAAFISNVWYPDNRSTAAYAARRGSTALGAAVGFRVLSEFVPFLNGSSGKFLRQ